MGKCILCDKHSKSEHLFCKDCFSKIKERANKLNFYNEQALKDYYFEQINNLNFNTYEKDFYFNQIALLYALSLNMLEDFYSDYLLNRVEADIQYLLNNKNTIQYHFNNNSFNDIDFRENWPREHQCEDGHYVRSLSEMLIDNWLYTHNYVHAYEKSVYMATNPEAIVLSDFYLPQGDVYIEFWGLEENEKYAKRKEEKIRLYDKNNLNRIDLNESHIKRLNDIMPRELGKYIKR